MTRLRFIDIAKGIGIVLVVCSHVWFPLMSWAAPCFIPLFFVCSGYCTTRRVNLRQRFIRLMVPYVLFSAALLCLHRSTGLTDIVGAVYSRWCLYPLGTDDNVFFLRSGNAPLWFLTSMFTALCAYWMVQRSRRRVLLMVVFLAVTFALSFLPVLLPWSADTALLMAMFMAAGRQVRRLSLLDRLKAPHVAGAVAVYAALWLCSGYVNLSVRQYGTSLFIMFPAAVIGSVLLMRLAMSAEQTVVGSVLDRLGRHSLGIFCMHLPFVSLWQKATGPLMAGMSTVVGSVVVVSLAIVCTYPLSVLADRYVFCHIGKIRV